MELRNQIHINAPRDFVASFLRWSEYFDKWQDDFKSATLLRGQKDQVGSQTLLRYKFEKSDMELVETIQANHLPHSFEALYEHKHMNNIMLSTFEELDGNRTLYTTQVNYIEMKSLLIKIMAKLFAGKFKKGPEKWMQQYKDYVEYKWDLEEKKL